MACDGTYPQILISSQELRAALGGDAAAVTRMLAAVCDWLGPQPLSTWQVFVARHPPDTAPIDAMVVHRIRTVMLVRQLPELLVTGVHRPPERVITAAQGWIYTHTNQWLERGVQRQLFANASCFVARCSETQVKEHRKDATQNAWESFPAQGLCRVGSLRRELVTDLGLSNRELASDRPCAAIAQKPSGYELRRGDAFDGRAAG